MNKLLRSNIEYILYDVAMCEPEQIETGIVEIFGETESGEDCSIELEITEICKAASNIIGELKEDIKVLESKQ